MLVKGWRVHRLFQYPRANSLVSIFIHNKKFVVKEPKYICGFFSDNASNTCVTIRKHCIFSFSRVDGNLPTEKVGTCQGPLYPLLAVNITV